MEKAFIYVRVSTQEQINGYSVGEQQERLEAYAKARGYTVVGKYIDPGYSGANTDRPALQEMIKNINNADIVIVYKLDRLSRSQRDTMYLIEDVFLKNDIHFVSVSESFDTSTPFGRAMVGILSVFAQLEREQIAERTMMGRIARAKDGYYHGGDPDKMATGYDYSGGELIVNEYEASCVKYIFESYIEGKGFGRIFEDIGVKFPGVIEDLSTVRKILRRPVYKGYIVFGGKEYKGRHDPIISEEDFEKVNLLMETRSAKFDSTPEQMYILSGFLRCGHCGARMAGKAGKKLKSGETMKYYVCYTRRGTPKHMKTADSCDKKFERKEVLEERIINEIKRLNIDTIKNESKKTDDEERINTLQNKIDKIDNQISKLVDLFADGNIPVDILNSKVEDLKKKKHALLISIDETKKEKMLDLNSMKEILVKVEDIDRLELVDQHAIISMLISEITLHDDKIEINWKF